MRKSYDFSNGVQGVHHKDYQEGHSVRVLVEADSHQTVAGPGLEDLEDVEMRPEYDFSKSVHSPYAALAGEVHIVTLDPDVKAVFADSESVNQALRLLIKAAKSAQELPKAS